jgi:hypothetical protein
MLWLERDELLDLLEAETGEDYCYCGRLIRDALHVCDVRPAYACYAKCGCGQPFVTESH